MFVHEEKLCGPGSSSLNVASLDKDAHEETICGELFFLYPSSVRHPCFVGGRSAYY